MDGPPRLRICLAASGGGHLRQLLDLKPFWDSHDVHFVTEDTPLARSLAGEFRVHLVPHLAFGQLRQSPRAFASGAIGNLRESRRAIRTERPHLVLSTGAGSAYFAVLFAKRRGARFVLIDSFARFAAPSLFARMTRRLADAVIVQSPKLAARWPEAEVFDPFVDLGPAAGDKEDLAVVTVGTVMPFDRLVGAVASLKPPLRPARVVAQVGKGGARPPAMETHETVPFDEMLALLDRAGVVFCHGGTGSLVTALRAGCRVVAMPRRAALGEHYDDHQSEIVAAFAERGLIEVAEEPRDLEAALQRALARPPRRATTDYTALVERLRALAAKWFAQPG